MTVSYDGTLIYTLRPEDAETEHEAGRNNSTGLNLSLSQSLSCVCYSNETA